MELTINNEVKFLDGELEGQEAYVTYADNKESFCRVTPKTGHPLDSITVHYSHLEIIK